MSCAVPQDNMATTLVASPLVFAKHQSIEVVAKTHTISGPSEFSVGKKLGVVSLRLRWVEVLHAR
jgi:hypothetical protein